MNKKEYSRKYYQRNREKLLEKAKEYSIKNREKILEYHKEHYQKNKNKRKQYQKEYIQLNSEKIKSKKRKYYLKNKEKFARQRKLRYEQNKEKELRRNKEYRKNNWDKILENKRIYKKKKIYRDYCKRKYRTDIKYNLDYKISNEIKRSLKNNKNGRKWESLVGYTLDNLIEHLKQTIPKGYTWQDVLNGKLHIDHIIPKSLFKYKIPDDSFKRCWALKNLQLLPAKENIMKSNKVLQRRDRHE
jgi:hypothetical protein